MLQGLKERAVGQPAENRVVEYLHPVGFVLHSLGEEHEEEASVANLLSWHRPQIHASLHANSDQTVTTRHPVNNRGSLATLDGTSWGSTEKSYLSVSLNSLSETRSSSSTTKHCGPMPSAHPAGKNTNFPVSNSSSFFPQAATYIASPSPSLIFSSNL
eukprot:2624197-Rhodomonas_salina.1